MALKSSFKKRHRPCQGKFCPLSFHFLQREIITPKSMLRMKVSLPLWNCLGKRRLFIALHVEPQRLRICVSTENVSFFPKESSLGTNRAFQVNIQFYTWEDEAQRNSFIRTGLSSLYLCGQYLQDFEFSTLKFILLVST